METPVGSKSDMLRVTNREAVFERGRRDLKIGAVVTERCAQLSPATR